MADLTGFLLCLLLVFPPSEGLPRSGCGSAPVQGSPSAPENTSAVAPPTHTLLHLWEFAIYVEPKTTCSKRSILLLFLTFLLVAFFSLYIFAMIPPSFVLYEHQRENPRPVVDVSSVHFSHFSGQRIETGCPPPRVWLPSAVLIDWLPPLTQPATSALRLEQKTSGAEKQPAERAGGHVCL